MTSALYVDNVVLRPVLATFPKAVWKWESQYDDYSYLDVTV